MNTKLTKIAFLGDLQCHSFQNQAIWTKYGRYQYIDTMSHVKEMFQDCDYVVGNLETPVSELEITNAAVRFNTPPAYLEAVKNIGVNFLQTCNNHCLDREEEGLDQTIDWVEKYGFDHSGTYKTKTSSEEIAVIEIKNLKFAFICCTYGTNSKYNGVMLQEDHLWKVDLLKKQEKKTRWEYKPEYGPMIVTYEPDSVNRAATSNSANIPYLDRISSKINKAKQIADVVIVMPHIGGQYNPAPGWYTKYIMDWITKIGCDLVVAGHPHVPLKCKFTNDVFCSYSLGNFHSYPGHAHYLDNVFSEYGIVLFTYWNEQGELVKTTFSIVKNIKDEDGIAHTYPLYDYYNNCESKAEKEVLEIDAEAVVNRIRGSVDDVFIDKEYVIFDNSN